MMFSYIYVCVVFIAWGVGLGRPENLWRVRGVTTEVTRGGFPAEKKKKNKDSRGLISVRTRPEFFV